MGPQQTLKWPSLHSIHRSLFFIAITATILISGVIRPLLVQCTPAGGLATIELIGQDPHRHADSEHFCEFSNSSPDDLFSSRVHDYGSCVDRLLNHTAILSVGSGNPLRASIWGECEKLSAAMSACAIPASGLLPNPVLRTAFHLQYKQPLLI
jgi:hypothetical protein